MRQPQISEHVVISSPRVCFRRFALLACLWLSGLSVAAWAEESDSATRFFTTHPNPIDLEESGNRIRFANRRFGIEFKRSGTGFHLTRLYDIGAGEDFLSGPRPIFHVVVNEDPMKVALDKRALTRPGGLGMLEAKTIEGEDFYIDSSAATSVSWRKEGTDEESVLHLEWDGIDLSHEKQSMSVEVTVTLRDGDPLSRWRINVRNRSKHYGVVRVRFPLLTLGPLATRKDVPRWFNVSPLYFYTHLDDAYAGTHSEQENLLVAADHLREFLDWSGMRLGAQIYAWREYHPQRSTFEVPFFYGRHPAKGAVGGYAGSQHARWQLPEDSRACQLFVRVRAAAESRRHGIALCLP